VLTGLSPHLLRKQDTMPNTKCVRSYKSSGMRKGTPIPQSTYPRNLEPLHGEPEADEASDEVEVLHEAIPTNRKMHDKHMRLCNLESCK